ncbi:hypothetical protein [Acetobacter sicerae]|uniref:hypothetical protein n=1 Tax=Acetobacter sicerae TaxID=85325 RepID=UPI00156B0BD5|nr:hypothetical protein [Acetobacter sicerae]NHN90356.1 hypothetical protein [Acetobacter sicerae]
MKAKLIALADQKLLEGDRSSACEAIRVFYMLYDAEELSKALLNKDLKNSQLKKSTSLTKNVKV